MMSTVYARTGLTTTITGNATAVTGNITIANGGPSLVKIDNINNANVDAFVNWSVNSNVVATIANTTTPGNSVCVQHGSTEFVQVNNPNNSPAKIYFSVAATAGSPTVYITPVAVVR